MTQDEKLNGSQQTSINVFVKINDDTTIVSENNTGSNLMNDVKENATEINNANISPDIKLETKDSIANENSKHCPITTETSDCNQNVTKSVLNIDKPNMPSGNEQIRIEILCENSMNPCDTNQIKAIKSACENEYEQKIRKNSNENKANQSVENSKQVEINNEDPMARLNKLRETIANRLKEVKAVLIQHGEQPSSNDDSKKDIQPEEDNVIRLKFVRKIRKRNQFSLDDESNDMQIGNHTEIRENKEETSCLTKKEKTLENVQNTEEELRNQFEENSLDFGDNKNVSSENIELVKNNAKKLNRNENLKKPKSIKKKSQTSKDIIQSDTSKEISKELVDANERIGKLDINKVEHNVEKTTNTIKVKKLARKKSIESKLLKNIPKNIMDNNAGKEFKNANSKKRSTIQKSLPVMNEKTSLTKNSENSARKTKNLPNNIKSASTSANVELTSTEVTVKDNVSTDNNNLFSIPEKKEHKHSDSQLIRRTSLINEKQENINKFKRHSIVGVLTNFHDNVDNSKNPMKKQPIKDLKVFNSNLIAAATSNTVQVKKQDLLMKPEQVHKLDKKDIELGIFGLAKITDLENKRESLQMEGNRSVVDDMENKGQSSQMSDNILKKASIDIEQNKIRNSGDDNVINCAKVNNQQIEIHDQISSNIGDDLENNLQMIRNDEKQNYSRSKLDTNSEIIQNQISKTDEFLVRSEKNSQDPFLINSNIENSKCNSEPSTIVLPQSNALTKALALLNSNGRKSKLTEIEKPVHIQYAANTLRKEAILKTNSVAVIQEIKATTKESGEKSENLIDDQAETHMETNASILDIQKNNTINIGSSEDMPKRDENDSKIKSNLGSDKPNNFQTQAKAALVTSQGNSQNKTLATVSSSVTESNRNDSKVNTSKENKHELKALINSCPSSTIGPETDLLSGVKYIESKQINEKQLNMRPDNYNIVQSTDLSENNIKTSTLTNGALLALLPVALELGSSVLKTKTDCEQNEIIKKISNTEELSNNESKIQVLQTVNNEFKEDSGIVKETNDKTLSSITNVSVPEKNTKSKNVKDDSSIVNKTDINDTESQVITGKENCTEIKTEGNEAQKDLSFEDLSDDELTTETKDDSEILTETSTKKRKMKKKVIIRRLKRKLSKDKSIDEKSTEPEICEKEIQSKIDEAVQTDLEKLVKKKSCLKVRAYEPGDIVLYADRIRKIVKWKKATVIDKITSISYTLNIEGDEKPAHISYIKKYTDKKVQFGAKEYLEIDYAQDDDDDDDDEDEENGKGYNIWARV